MSNINTADEPWKIKNSYRERYLNSFFPPDLNTVQTRLCWKGLNGPKTYQWKNPQLSGAVNTQPNKKKPEEGFLALLVALPVSRWVVVMEKQSFEACEQWACLSFNKRLRHWQFFSSVFHNFSPTRSGWPYLRGRALNVRLCTDILNLCTILNPKLNAESENLEAYRLR